MKIFRHQFVKGIWTVFFLFASLVVIHDLQAREGSPAQVVYHRELIPMIPEAVAHGRTEFSLLGGLYSFTGNPAAAVRGQNGAHLPDVILWSAGQTSEMQQGFLIDDSGSLTLSRYISRLADSSSPDTPLYGGASFFAGRSGKG
ncbi:MAG: hypothetical protein D6B26_07745, partial [Spirochaetaceae bacterium]